MDKYTLQQFTSTRQVALNKIETGSKKISSIALFGDPAFSLDSSAMVKLKRPGQTASEIITAQEVEKVKQLFDKQALSAILFTKASATEENLKSLNGNAPQVLHIATHGFFLPEPAKEENGSTLNGQDTYTLAADPGVVNRLLMEWKMV